MLLTVGHGGTARGCSSFALVALVGCAQAHACMNGMHMLTLLFTYVGLSIALLMVLTRRRGFFLFYRRVYLDI